MTAKPPKIKKETVYTYWESGEGMCCPLCGKRLIHELNDGGREVKTLKGPLWVITNYCRCVNLECNAQYTVFRRKWRIRDEETGNFKLFDMNLETLKECDFC